MTDDICLRPATEMARRLRRREIGAAELLELHLARVERLNPRLNAVVVLQAEAARERARAADAALARGEGWGPLHGVPMTVKESFDLVGTPTTWGFETQRHNIARGSAVAVQRLLDAGAVIFGKTNVPVALADWQSFNPVYGTTRNPWHLERAPGGSSGGSAAALAAGLSALELGSDIGASIRNPAHYCGVWGHKPTWGVVPMAGHELPGEVCPDATDIGAAGPLARSAHDLTLAMDLLASPLTVFGPMGRVPVAWRDDGRAAPALRVAIVNDDAVAPVDGAVRGAIDRLAAFLRDRGVVVGTAARPVDSRQHWRVYVKLVRSALVGHLSEAEYNAALERAAACSGSELEFPALQWKSQTMSHREWLLLDEERHAMRAQWARFFKDWDLLICPVAATDAMPHNQAGYRWERFIDVDGRPQPTTTQLFWAGYPGVVGLPATAVPLELSPRGLPVGAQLVGPAFSDPVCLRFARWLESEYRGFVAPPLALG